MSRSAPFRLNRSGMLLALVSAALAGEAGAAAGRTEFVIGGVTIARNGVERPLTRGLDLDNGDVVRTNDGRAQIRFTDGAYVSLQPNTDFAIRDYRFENKTDGSERGFFGLVKGAMRTVTGLIGRVNRDRYQIVTPTATVGIRGTGGVIQVLQDGSTLVIGTSGIWSLTNPAGSIDVPAGVSGLSPTDPDEPPSQTTTQPTSGPTQLPPQEPVFVQGNEVDSSGAALVETQITPLVTGSGYAVSAAFGEEFNFGQGPFYNGQVVSSESADAVFNSAGEMTSLTFSDPFGGTLQYQLGSGGSHADFGTDGILAWGRWVGPTVVTGANCDGPCSPTNQDYSSNQGFHYVVGLPAPVLPTTGTYTLLGATRPTYVDGSTAPGTFSGQLDVTISGRSGTVAANFTVAMPDNTYGLAGSTSLTSSSFRLFPTPTGCVSCSGRIDGFFSGATAERAGVSYHIDDFNRGKEVVGAAAFQKQ